MYVLMGLVSVSAAWGSSNSDGFLRGLRIGLLQSNQIYATSDAVQVGQWGNCSQPCGGGIRGRSVQCVTQFLQPAPDNASCVGVQPADQLQCNVLPCNFCSQTNCAGQVTHLDHRTLQILPLLPKRLPRVAFIAGIMTHCWCVVWRTDSGAAEHGAAVAVGRCCA